MPTINLNFNQSKYDDIVYLSKTLPDITYVYTEGTIKSVLTKIDLGRYKTYFNHILLGVLVFQTMLIILVLRCVPRLISIPTVLALTYISVTNNCGAVLVLYIITDTFFWLIRGRKHVCPMTAPISHTSKDPWWTKELNGLILLLLIMSHRRLHHRNNVCLLRSGGSVDFRDRLSN